MSRHKILFQSNAPFLKSGLAENGRMIMNWLAKRGKYDLTYLCTQTHDNDPNLNRLPYKAYGSLPSDQNEMQQLLQPQNQGAYRFIAYGGRSVGQVVAKEKPTIWVGSDDIWAFPPNGYCDTSWFKSINSVLHITVDSVPVSPMAYEQAKKSKHFLSWAEFAVNEMKRQDPAGCGHVDFIYGASDTTKFKPISLRERTDLRRQLGFDPKDVIFLFLGRNQLRKEFLNVLQAFSEFKKEFPFAKAKLLFHTDWSDRGVANGWDIKRLRDYFKIPVEDVLCTYVCRNCGKWEVRPYDGEEKDCRACGAQKSLVTPDGWGTGVSDEELHLVYGLCDASISAFTSGGLEMHNVQSLLSGLPLACTNYSCGEDFCKQSFVYPINWTSRFEHQSSFMKASNDINSIKGFLSKIYKMTVEERTQLGLKGRDWAAKEFHIDAIGAKWEKLFDSMPMPDWSSITLTPKPKNDKFPFPQILDQSQFIKTLYNEILLVEPDPDGFKNWSSSLERGARREDVYNFFINEARKENAKNEPAKDFSIFFDQNGRKKILFVMKESGGDLFISTSLFKGLKELYPDSDLYVGLDPKFNEVLAGNPYVYRLIPFHPAMKSELIMMNYVDHYYYPAIATQEFLGYLSHDEIGVDLKGETK